MRLILCCAALLAGCATTAPVPEKVLVPVIKTCVTEPPTKPATHTEAELLAMDDYAATIQTWVERLNLKAYAEKADAVIQGCR